MHPVTGGDSDAGISAALLARELDPEADVTVVVADAYPNFSICGIPYDIAGDVGDWRNLAHRSVTDIEAAGLHLRLETTARSIEASTRRLLVTDRAAGEELLTYDALVVATGATPIRRPIAGLVGTRRSARTTASICFITWATPSPSCTPSNRSSRPGR